MLRFVVVPDRRKVSRRLGAYGLGSEYLCGGVTVEPGVERLVPRSARSVAAGSDRRGVRPRGPPVAAAKPRGSAKAVVPLLQD